MIPFASNIHAAARAAGAALVVPRPREDEAIARQAAMLDMSLVHSSRLVPNEFTKDPGAGLVIPFVLPEGMPDDCVLAYSRFGGRMSCEVGGSVADETFQRAAQREANEETFRHLTPDEIASWTHPLTGNSLFTQEQTAGLAAALHALHGNPVYQQLCARIDRFGAEPNPPCVKADSTEYFRLGFIAEAIVIRPEDLGHLASMLQNMSTLGRAFFDRRAQVFNDAKSARLDELTPKDAPAAAAEDPAQADKAAKANENAAAVHAKGVAARMPLSQYSESRAFGLVRVSSTTKGDVGGGKIDKVPTQLLQVKEEGLVAEGPMLKPLTVASDTRTLDDADDQAKLVERSMVYAQGGVRAEVMRNMQELRMEALRFTREARAEALHYTLDARVEARRYVRSAGAEAALQAQLLSVPSVRLSDRRAFPIVNIVAPSQLASLVPAKKSLVCFDFDGLLVLYGGKLTEEMFMKAYNAGKERDKIGNHDLHKALSALKQATPGAVPFEIEKDGVPSKESDLVYRAFTAARELKTTQGTEQITLAADETLAGQLESLENAGHVLMISTSRGPEQKEMTLRQLKNTGLDRFFPPQQVACTGKDETKSQFMTRTAVELGIDTVCFADDSRRYPEEFNSEEYRHNVETLKKGFSAEQVEALENLEIRLAHMDLANPSLKEALFPGIAAQLPGLLKKHDASDPMFVVDLLR